MRWTSFLCAVVAVCFGMSVRAGDPEPAAKIDLAKEIGDLVKTLRDQTVEQRSTNSRLLDLVTKHDRLLAEMQQVHDEVTGLKRQIEDIKPRLSVAPTELQSIREEIASLKRSMEDFKARQGTTTVSKKVTGSASVRFVNRYFSDMTVVVNGTTITVPANEERTVSMAPGTVMYQILQHQSIAKTDVLSENQVLTVTLKPTL